jgi:hypothetical protein
MVPSPERFRQSESHRLIGGLLQQLAISTTVRNFWFSREFAGLECVAQQARPDCRATTASIDDPALASPGLS